MYVYMITQEGNCMKSLQAEVANVRFPISVFFHVLLET